MRRLDQMGNTELQRLKEELEGMIRDQDRAGRPIADLVEFRNRIDDEMAARGA